MRLYRFKPEDFGLEKFKCPVCGWRSRYIYILADSEEQAKELFRDGVAGMCGECIAELLSSKNYIIYYQEAIQ